MPEQQDAVPGLYPRESEKPGHVYFVRYGDLIKIGKTTESVATRVRAMQGMSPVPLELVGMVKCGCPHDFELTLHNAFAEDRQHGEWFTVSDKLRDLATGVLTPEYFRKAGDPVCPVWVAP